MRRSRSSSDPGFTLVEMLVVVAIIGVLAAILVPTLGNAIRRAKTAAVALEINELSKAINAYKGEHNDQPPDFTSIAAVIAHMKRAYPRNTLSVNPQAPKDWFDNPPWQPNRNNATPFPDPYTLDAAEALVFWLSLVSSNPRDPLFVDLPDLQNRKPNDEYLVNGPGDPKVFFSFDQQRLVDDDGDGWPEYVSKHAPNAPYIYFDGRVINARARNGSLVPTYAYAWARYPSPFDANNAPPTQLVRDRSQHPLVLSPTPATQQVIRPYRSNNRIDAADTKTWPNDAGAANPFHNTKWINEGEFQIVMGGLDNELGFDNQNASGELVFKRFPDPNYYLQPNLEFVSDDDNMTSFSEGRTVGDSIP